MNIPLYISQRYIQNLESNSKNSVCIRASNYAKFVKI